MTETIHIALAGLGTVGCRVASLLQQNQDIITARCGKQLVLSAVSARDKHKKRSCSLDDIPWFDNPLTMLEQTPCHIAVELIGGADGIAKDFVTQALEKRCSVVTANKALLAKHGRVLFQSAARHQIAIAFEASVGGGIPIIRSLQDNLAANHIYHITAILNGTCNYILSQMRSQKKPFHDILKEAQCLGYAESDPTTDIDGSDAAHKLAILVALAWGQDFSSSGIEKRGIQDITAEDIDISETMGYRLKHIAQAYPLPNKTIHQSVHPCLVAKSHALSHVDGVFNAITFLSDACGTLTLIGEGAGGATTASAVLADIISLGRQYPHNHAAIPPRPIALKYRGSSEKMPHYLSIHAKDQPGVLATIAATLGENHISIETAWQQAPHRQHAHLAIITHPCTPQDLSHVQERLAHISTVLSKPRVFPIIN